MADALPVTDWSSLPDKCDIVVIGAGAGGAVTAATLAEGGRDTIVLEEGGVCPQTCPPYGKMEMLTAYRRRGMTVALGNAPINYAEARCVGGGSEINSGLYHRPPPETLKRWAQAGVHGADSSEIAEICAENERDLSITRMPGEVQPASRILADGAAAVGWECPEIPRWHQYDSSFTPTAPGGTRQSMSRTFLPRFIAAGGRLVAGCEVHALRRESNEWEIHANCNGNPMRLRARQVFVAAGAVRTPSLLRNSGYRRYIGNTLRMHIFTRVLAEFDKPINSDNAGIGPHQIETLAPRLRFGCGVSTPAHLAAAIAQCGNAEWQRDHSDRWRHRASYYAAIGGGIGWIKNIGGSEAVFYKLRQNDFYDLADGMRALARVLFAAGAVKALPIIKGATTLHSENDLWRLPRPLQPSRACLTSVHLMGSCPMAAATDSVGAVRGADGLHIADASLFCDSPNVNPQGTVMAFARRNARHYLSAS